MKMTHSIRLIALSALFSLLLAAGSAFADQAAWISEDAAKEAQSILKKQTSVIEFCEPCGDTARKETSVKTVEYKKADDPAYMEVSLNGEPIDLAYIYIKSGNKWLNLAIVLGLPVEGVSEELK